mmetsp:Transcript_12456/g.21120  ORF Transcript_12456/g.21120 Transcript_12456/m.21120 type:complete len:250 (+) Transcript_12456:913-1662(+)
MLKGMDSGISFEARSFGHDITCTVSYVCSSQIQKQSMFFIHQFLVVLTHHHINCTSHQSQLTKFIPCNLSNRCVLCSSTGQINNNYFISFSSSFVTIHNLTQLCIHISFCHNTSLQCRSEFSNFTRLLRQITNVLGCCKNIWWYLAFCWLIRSRCYDSYSLRVKPILLQYCGCSRCLGVNNVRFATKLLGRGHNFKRYSQLGRHFRSKFLCTIDCICNSFNRTHCSRGTCHILGNGTTSDESNYILFGR